MFCAQYFPYRLKDRYQEEGYFDFRASSFIAVSYTHLNEEKKLRRSYDTGGASDCEDSEDAQPSTMLSLDAVPEDDVKAVSYTHLCM